LFQPILLNSNQHRPVTLVDVEYDIDDLVRPVKAGTVLPHHQLCADP